MGVIRDTYPYEVKYSRTPSWYERDWREISAWCNENCDGDAGWEYDGYAFLFKTDMHRIWFMLRWGTNHKR